MGFLPLPLLCGFQTIPLPLGRLLPHPVSLAERTGQWGSKQPKAGKHSEITEKIHTGLCPLFLAQSS